MRAGRTRRAIARFTHISCGPALQLAIEDPHRAVTYVGVACSGAETVFGLFLRYKGHEWVPNPPELSQISALAEAQCGGRAAPDYDLPRPTTSTARCRTCRAA
jgi:hypothetical protein